MAKVLVIGAINWDINLHVERFAKVGEEIPVSRITRVPGGKAANVAVAAARILGPNRVSLIGALGNDSIAEAQIEILTKEGVDTSSVKIVDGESGQAYIVIDSDGRNMIHTLFGANLEIAPEDLLESKRRRLIDESSLITIMDPPLETVFKMAELGRARDRTVLWDPGVRSSLGVERLKRVLELIQYLVVNEVEVGNLAGTTDSSKAISSLLEVNESLRLIVKLGSEGCLMATGDGSIKIPGVPLGRFGMRVVNTVGCGDAFLGVLSASLVSGFEVLEALKRANLAGAFKATRPETRGSPTERELKEFAQKMA